MKLFTFNCSQKPNKHIDDNGWVFNSKFKGDFGCFLLKTPIMREITYSKGPAVRYQKHLVYGIGFIKHNHKFCGIALFDPHIRFLVSFAILIGVAYVSMKFYIGIIWAILFYILVSFLSLEDDNSLIHRCQLMYES